MSRTATEFTHRTGSYLSLGDADLYYEVAGTQDRPPLLLLHGGLGDIRDFNSIAGELAEDFCLIGLDFRGHGRSSLGSAPLTYERYQQDVATLLQHLNVNNFSVLGFSDGGIVGYRLAVEYQSRLRALVTIGAQWRLRPSDPAFSMLSGLTPEIWESMFPESRAYYDSVNPSPDFSRLVTLAVALWTDPTASGYPADRVGCIATPTLVVRGDSDFLFSLSEAAELRATLPTASLFNVPLAGHEVHKDSPLLFLAGVKAFLAEPRTPNSLLDAGQGRDGCGM